MKKWLLVLSFISLFVSSAAGAQIMSFAPNPPRNLTGELAGECGAQLIPVGNAAKRIIKTALAA